MYLTQALHRARRQSPQSTATVCGGRRRTYAELGARVERLASALKTLGVMPGDTVGMLAQNSDRYLEYYLATYWAGAAVHPINNRWSAAEIAYSLNDCQTRLLIVDDAHLHLLPEIHQASTPLQKIVHAGDGPAPAGTHSYEALIEAAAPLQDAVRRDGDVAGVFYTGGTTGSPKGVVLSHANLYTNAMTIVAETAITSGARGLHVAPMFHLADAGFMNALLMRGAANVIAPAFDPLAVLKLIAAEQVTDCLFVPTMIQMLVDHPERPSHDVGSVCRVIYGASPIAEAVLDRALKAFPKAAFVQGYGMTELSSVAAILPPECHVGEHRAAGKLRSAGRAAICSELRVVDEAGTPVPTGVVGEIVARGPGVMQGYLNKPEETAAVLRDGWMHTGDGGYLDADGFVYVVDRIKDMIVTGGENVYSAEVENALLKHPAVAMCAVIGIPDERWGECVHAVMVLRPGAEAVDLEALRAHTRQHIAGYKCPRSIEFRPALPLSGAGKVMKNVLREPHWQNRGRKVS